MQWPLILKTDNCTCFFFPVIIFIKVIFQMFFLYLSSCFLRHSFSLYCCPAIFFMLVLFYFFVFL